MLARIIAQRTNSAIMFYLRPSEAVQEIDSVVYVRNIWTGEIGFIDGYCPDPYAISEPETVAYVICRNADDTSNYSDHWHLDDYEVLS